MEFQPKPSDYSENPNKYEFKVYLTILVGGHGGLKSLNDKPLFFDYSTEYYYFTKILQDETQLSVIPPMHLTHSKYISPEALSQRLEQRKASRGQIQRGYTVLDGPWLYKIRKNNQVQIPPWDTVQDGTSYAKMLDAVKDANTADPKYESALLMVHVSQIVFLFTYI